MQKTMERSKIQQDFVVAAKFIKKHDRSNEKLGVVGFFLAAT
ncbi:MAG: carboxymethylenebutenolidase [Cognaticolwellia sp.]|jgi:carboxymethylenebutenolidase